MGDAPAVTVAEAVKVASAVAAPLTPDLPVVPGYEILTELGRGGMGVVYKARQIKANRVVALKMILAHRHADLQDKIRFQIEAEAVARLQHPHIVQLHEVGEAEGLPFFSLEFCGGGALDGKLNGQPWVPREAAMLLEKLARAMHCAHSRGVVHRDLKPGNVLLDTEGEPKITDFGLAKRLDAASDVSRTGNIVGTPSYMAPEQAEGRTRDIGPGTDVYALGAILYELLTGIPPFRGATLLDTLAMVSTQEPAAPSRANPRVPRDLETICLKCLHKSPERRYATAGALAEDLRRFLVGEPITARPVGAAERVIKWARRHPAVAALLLVTVLGVAGIVWKYVDAERQKGIALEKERETRQEAEKARKARDFLVSIFRISQKDMHGSNVTARQILNDAEKRIPLEFADQPELRAELLKAIEEVNDNIGRTIPAAMILEVRGSVQLHSARGLNQPPVPQLLLFPEDRLTLGADAHLRLVFLTDGYQERVNPAREVAIHRRGCQPPESVSQRSQDMLMTFARLPKGTFYMGGGGGTAGQKTVIKEDFEIAVHTVTQGQWQAVMGNNPSYFSRTGKGREHVLDISDEELNLFPVEMVSWEDAQQFINKLNERGRGQGWSYRLPTEEEWEYACRGGATSAKECSFHYYFAGPTNDIATEQANFNGNAPFVAPPNRRYLQRTTRVGAYPTNKLGLCDMHGNVWQWCADPWKDDASARAVRGGGWGASASSCQAGYCYGFAPTERISSVGFRLVRVQTGRQ